MLSSTWTGAVVKSSSPLLPLQCIAARSQYRLSGVLSEATEQHQTDISLSSSEAEAESVDLGNRLAWQLDSSGKMPCSIKVCAGDIVPANQPLVIQSLIETV